MFALVRRNIKIYFSNIPGVIMSCMGALISFLIYIGFLQKNLENSWSHISNITEILDLWIIAGVVAIAGITTSYQALGQLVRDRESRTTDDMQLTDVSAPSQNLAYVLSSSLVSFIMQLITLLVMSIYFVLVDKITIPNNAFLPAILYIFVGAIATTLLNAIIVFWMHSSTTFSRFSAIINAASGFVVATYTPYGTLSTQIQNVVKLIPSSYEAASLRSLLLNKAITNLPNDLRTNLRSYLGINFKINGYQLTRMDNLYILLGMIVLLAIVIVILSSLADRRRK